MDNLESNELIVFMPKRQYTWTYTIDDGKQHTIDQDDMLNYTMKFIDKSERTNIEDMMSRHVPFGVLIKERKVMELKKENDTENYYREKLIADLNDPMKFMIQNNPVKRDDKTFSSSNEWVDRFCKDQWKP